jgi:hypothetical protein
MLGVAFSDVGASWRTPTMSTTGGITIGRRVMPSKSRRNLGTRRWMKTAVGTISSRVITVVMRASRSDK